MATLSIKDVPPAWAEALRRRAARNHRSLQGELMAIIEQAAISSGQACESGNALHANTPPAAAGMPTAIRRGYKTIEQIYAEHLERFPQPFTEGPMSVDIIRQDRDSR